MEESIVYEKDVGHLGMLAVLLCLPASIFLWPLFMGGLTARALEVSVYAFPVSAFFVYSLYGLHVYSRRKIVLDNAGLLVEDLSVHSIPWPDILDVRIVQQPVPQGPTASWLVLHVKDPRRYSSKFIQKANRLLVGGGVPACNLATYNERPEVIRTAILARLRRGPSNANRGDD